MLWYHELKYVVAMQRRFHVDMSNELLKNMSKFQVMEVIQCSWFQRGKTLVNDQSLKPR